MSGQPITLGPFTKGLHNSAGTGEYIDNAELFELVNLEVDTDGSLVNRPAISMLELDSGFGEEDKRILGVYQPGNGKRYLVITFKNSSDYSVGLLDLDDNSLVGEEQGFTSYCACGVQYNNKFFVYPKPGTADVAGYYDDTETWTQQALPGGQAAACVIYKERLFAVAGIDSTSETSRMYFSEIADPTDFDGTMYVDVSPGNGEKLTNIVLLNNDVVLFKEHSTFRAGYSGNIEKMEISIISSNVGSPKANCVAVTNNTVYVIHENAVYEMYNYNYQKISSGLSMTEGRNYPDVIQNRTALSVYNDRLFVRYLGRTYVLSVLSGRWCEWTTNRPFEYVTVVATEDSSIGYAWSIANDKRGELYSLLDNRIANVEDEDFTCRVVTKTYDFDISHTYKVLFWWGLTIATLGDTTARVVSPNAGPGNTWQMLHDNFTDWDDLVFHDIRWTSANAVIHALTIPSDIGAYSRKFLKFPKKSRFRQMFFEITSEAKPNRTADAAVRIYDIVAFVKSKETVPRRTTA